MNVCTEMLSAWDCGHCALHCGECARKCEHYIELNSAHQHMSQTKLEELALMS